MQEVWLEVWLRGGEGILEKGERSAVWSSDIRRGGGAFGTC